jgi:hypothetical protein
MSTLSVRKLRMPDTRALLRRAWAFNRPLTFVGVLMLVTLIGTLVGILVDPLVLTGQPAWIKPAKFAISISIYCFTLLWLLTFVRGRRRIVGLVAAATATALAVEEVIIVGQVLRGATSHFNIATQFDGTLWEAMGLTIAVVLVANLATVVLLLLQRLPDPAFAWALRLGLMVSFVGMGVAMFMVFPTPAQLSAAEITGTMAIAGAHSVGVEDGGPGLPLVGWSITGGDLRIPHFAGLHGLQILPMVGFFIATLRVGWLGTRYRVALVWTAGLTYLGFVLLLTWQALRGQPLVAPDASTLGMLGAIVAAAAVSVSAVLLLARRNKER